MCKFKFAKINEMQRNLSGDINQKNNVVIDKELVSVKSINLDGDLCTKIQACFLEIEDVNGATPSLLLCCKKNKLNYFFYPFSPLTSVNMWAFQFDH